MNELISVIVPVYNVEKYIKRCIYSIINQTYTNLEIIIVDDGSTDSSGKICDSFLSVDNRIRVYHKQNGGLSSARNFGIDKSKGSILSFIDSDDYINQNFFNILMKAKKETNADIVSSNILTFSDENEISENIANITEYQVIYGIDILNEYFAPKCNKRYIYHGLCMKIYNRDLFNLLRFEDGKLHEDLYITYQLLERAKKFCFVDLGYYYYYQGNVSSICKNFTQQNFFDIYNSFEKIKAYFKNNKSIHYNLNHFLIIEYMNLIQQSKNILDSSIKDYVSSMKKFIFKNIIFDDKLTNIRKFKIIIKLLLI